MKIYILRITFLKELINVIFRAELPAHVVTMLNNMPSKLHPMSQFSAAVTALNSESLFAKAYSDGVPKTKYWEVRSPQYTIVKLVNGIDTATDTRRYMISKLAN